jgi:hypothetical protein
VNAFLNIPIAEEDRNMTAFIMPFGLYHFHKLPFGLHGAPKTFTELIQLLEESIGESTELAAQILIYFDDCLLCGSTREEFLLILEVFLTQLHKMHRKINIKKCQLGLPSIKWLGHELSDQGIQPAKELTSTIKNWPTQQISKNFEQCLVPSTTVDLSMTASQTTKMRKLLQKEIPFKWTNAHKRNGRPQKNIYAPNQFLCTLTFQMMSISSEH